MSALQGHFPQLVNPYETVRNQRPAGSNPIPYAPARLIIKPHI